MHPGRAWRGSPQLVEDELEVSYLERLRIEWVSVPSDRARGRGCLRRDLRARPQHAERARVRCGGHVPAHDRKGGAGSGGVHSAHRSPSDGGRHAARARGRATWRAPPRLRTGPDLHTDAHVRDERNRLGVGDLARGRPLHGGESQSGGSPRPTPSIGPPHGRDRYGVRVAPGDFVRSSRVLRPRPALDRARGRSARDRAHRRVPTRRAARGGRRGACGHTECGTVRDP